MCSVLLELQYLFQSSTNLVSRMKAVDIEKVIASFK